MRQEIISAAGVDMELTMLRDGSSRHWLVMARWQNELDELQTHTMPPLDPALDETQAWQEARAWAPRLKTSEQLENQGLQPKFQTHIV
ncbi:hypothetical protein [Billgrantia bachuensis]|uniref:Uncharacterized protein n=1 Tax=Billgrantia bachuensis TaxID=2717286 RepID=A0ABX0PQ83_9GAMM|nr:hypothetical protein [Halomonas bachuensis]NIC05276.1 hypothetical protein [Halomonas bachuensis]